MNIYYDKDANLSLLKDKKILLVVIHNQQARLPPFGCRLGHSTILHSSAARA